MTLVDTSVWIDFLEGREHWTKNHLKTLLAGGETIAYMDLILLEIIQGVRTAERRDEIVSHFQPFTLLPVSQSAVVDAATIYQDLQREGLRIRSIFDGLIAAVAMRTGARLLHKDRDFDQIARFYALEVVSPDAPSLGL